jgi:hypothetical protein
MSNLLDKMMNKADMNVKLDPKRAELASAITKTFLNKVMPDIKTTLAQVEGMKKPEGGKTD